MKLFWTLIIAFLTISLGPLMAQQEKQQEKQQENDTKLSEADAKAIKEGQECYSIAKSVCGVNETIDKCLLTKRGRFSSFCVERLTENSNDLKQMTDQVSMQKCTVDLSKKCELEIPEDQLKPDMNKLRAAMAKYQKCMTEKVDTESSCNQAKEKLSDDLIKKRERKNY